MSLLQSVERLWRRNEGRAGVGIVFEEAEDGALVVASLLPDGPAEKSGKIAAGDVLYEIDGHNVYRADKLKVAEKMVARGGGGSGGGPGGRRKAPGGEITLGFKRGMRYEPDPLFFVTLRKEVMEKIGVVERFWKAAGGDK
mmetsp:Transcript_9838/g.23436  ORF Transcript_9838/g.23436 Transcript_9838/m.23436 type:complete len:141 (-) Transcript_9838:23-445(-)|eukprot:993475-Rhodomonas_salina.2